VPNKGRLQVNSDKIWQITSFDPQAPKEAALHLE
jgi:hypothetical protein